ncbi:hypothetical protein PSTT_06015 [Puccinia striiformis]|uniref:RING-type domain-containing protein n=2 Tax=Puccinia striiformis TaxID=27350 RepID=A0A2S4VMH6_9BASI|nr:hypothetical protein PSTT_06015 [Puccinia striiformis]
MSLLVFRAIAPAALLPEEELPSSHNYISPGIAEQLGPASERVQYGPLEDRRDSTRLSERMHGAPSSHTAPGTHGQSALDGHQSQWRDLQAGTGENSRPTVQPDRLVRFLQPISRWMQGLSWRMRRRLRREIKIQVHQQFDAFLDTLTPPTEDCMALSLHRNFRLRTVDYCWEVRYFWDGMREIHQGLLRALHANPKHNLKEGDPIPNTKTLGYMPRPPGYQSKTVGANAIETVPLDQAIGMLKATFTNVPESGPMDAGGIIEEQKVNIDREKNQDVNCKDPITSYKPIHQDAEGSTRPTSSLQEISEVLLGDPLHTSCVVCHEEFSQPKENSENAWIFEKIIKIDNCVHYFHSHCLGEWISNTEKLAAQPAVNKSFHQLHMLAQNLGGDNPSASRSDGQLVGKSKSLKPSMKGMSKAEQRAIQEKQRADKAVLKGSPAVSASTKQPTGKALNNPPTAARPPGSSLNKCMVQLPYILLQGPMSNEHQMNSNHNGAIPRLERLKIAVQLCNGAVLFAVCIKSLGLILALGLKEAQERDQDSSDTMQFRLDVAERNLKEGDPITNTKTLGYMPKPTEYATETNTWFTLEQAIGMLKATPTTLPESGYVDVEGIVKEPRVNINREKTEDEDCKDHINSIHHGAEGSTRPISSLQAISEVLLGDPLHTSCVICHEEFSQPETNS